MSRKKEIEYLINTSWQLTETDRAHIKRKMQLTLDDAKKFKKEFQKMRLNPEIIEKDNKLYPKAQVALGYQTLKETLDNFDTHDDDIIKLYGYSIYALDIPDCRDNDLEELYDEETCKIMSRMFNKVDPKKVAPEYLAWSGEYLYQIVSGEIFNDFIKKLS